MDFCLCWTDPTICGDRNRHYPRHLTTFSSKSTRFSRFPTHGRGAPRVCALLEAEVSHYDWVGFYLVDPRRSESSCWGPTWARLPARAHPLWQGHLRASGRHRGDLHHSGRLAGRTTSPAALMCAPRSWSRSSVMARSWASSTSTPMPSRPSWSRGPRLPESVCSHCHAP